MFRAAVTSDRATQGGLGGHTEVELPVVAVGVTGTSLSWLQSQESRFTQKSMFSDILGTKNQKDWPGLKFRARPGQRNSGGGA